MDRRPGLDRPIAIARHNMLLRSRTPGDPVMLDRRLRCKVALALDEASVLHVERKWNAFLGQRTGHMVHLYHETEEQFCK